MNIVGVRRGLDTIMQIQKGDSVKVLLLLFIYLYLYLRLLAHLIPTWAQGELQQAGEISCTKPFFHNVLIYFERRIKADRESQNRNVGLVSIVDSCDFSFPVWPWCYHRTAFTT